jgi:hypothetical protein
MRIELKMRFVIFVVVQEAMCKMFVITRTHSWWLDNHNAIYYSDILFEIFEAKLS